MKKTLFTTAVAFVLSIGGIALSAQDSANSITLDKDYSLVRLVVESNVEANLKESLTVSEEGGKADTFGYVKNGGGFVSLVDKVAEAQGENPKSAEVVLGKFRAGDTFQFGYGNAGGFTPVAPTVKVASDAGYYAEYNIDTFYQLDFSQDAFNGKVDILVMPEPLPSSTVSMLIALAAAGAFLLYRNRKTRAHSSAQA